jgi:hypothetical protein
MVHRFAVTSIVLERFLETRLQRVLGRGEGRAVEPEWTVST